MTYLPELRDALVSAAERQSVTFDPGANQPVGRVVRSSRTARYTRAALASLALGLAGTAAGAVHVGAPLGPEAPLSSVSEGPVAPTSGAGALPQR